MCIHWKVLFPWLKWFSDGQWHCHCVCIKIHVLLCCDKIQNEQFSYRQGYHRESNTCVDIKECSDPSTNTCTLPSFCVELQGSYTCSCRGGYQLVDGVSVPIRKNPKKRKCKVVCCYPHATTKRTVWFFQIAQSSHPLYSYHISATPCFGNVGFAHAIRKCVHFQWK